MDLTTFVATKYFGGHSDMLGGVLIVKTSEEWNTVRLHCVLVLFLPFHPHLPVASQR